MVNVANYPLKHLQLASSESFGAVSVVRQSTFVYFGRVALNGGGGIFFIFCFTNYRIQHCVNKDCT